jgi:hypothetical protein
MTPAPNATPKTERDLRAIALAASVGLVLAASGCGQSRTAHRGATNVAPATTSPSTGQTSAASSSTGVGPGGTTAPGATLAPGVSALVDYQPGGEPNSPTYHLQVGVMSIQKGAKADMSGVHLEKAQQGQTPYYVRLRIRNTGGGDASAEDGVPAVGFQAVDDRGQEGQELTVLGTFPRCESVTQPKHFTHGVTYETCVIYMVGGGGSIVQEDWTGSGGDAYTEKPIVWKAKG